MIRKGKRESMRRMAKRIKKATHWQGPIVAMKVNGISKDLFALISFNKHLTMDRLKMDSINTTLKDKAHQLDGSTIVNMDFPQEKSLSAKIIIYESKNALKIAFRQITSPEYPFRFCDLSKKVIWSVNGMPFTNTIITYNSSQTA